MPKFRVELEQADLQMMFSLMGQGYNGLIDRIGKQLEAGPLPEPKANGAAEPVQEVRAPNG